MITCKHAAASACTMPVFYVSFPWCLEANDCYLNVGHFGGNLTHPKALFRGWLKVLFTLLTTRQTVNSLSRQMHEGQLA